MAFACLFFFLADVNSFARSSCFEDHLSKQKGHPFCQGDGGRIDCVVTATGGEPDKRNNEKSQSASQGLSLWNATKKFSQTGKDKMEHALVPRFTGEPWSDD